MKVVYLSPEVAPFSKTGGLAEYRGVAAKLKSLARSYSNHPFYGNVKADKHPLEKPIYRLR